MSGDPLLLVDGNSLTYRAFFALPTDLATASGQVTNAVFGFTSMLINLMRDHGPADRRLRPPEPTFRHERVESYKANREAAPDILRQQVGLVREVVETLGITVLELPGYEADDIIATLATQARDAGMDVIVVTGDRDVYQLVEDPHVKVLYNRRGVSDYVLYDEAGIEERTGVPPRLYLPYAALRGDPSDNLPGVPGVGEKTAARLVNTYGSLDGIFEHLDELSPKLRANRAEHEQQVRTNAEVMALVRDAPVGVTVDDLLRRPADVEAVRRLFDFLEFHSLGERLTRRSVRTRLGGPAGGDRGRGHRARHADAASPRSGGRTRGGRPLAIPRRGPERGRSPRRLAFVTDAAGVWRMPARCSTTTGCGRAGPRRPVAEVAAIAAHQAKAIMRSLLALEVDLRSWRSTRHRRLPARPGRAPLPARRGAAPLRRGRAAGRRRGGRGPARPRRVGRQRRAPHRPPRPGGRPAGRAAGPGARRPVDAGAQRRDRGAARAGARSHGARRGGRRRRRAAGPARPPVGRGRALRLRHLGRRAWVQHQLDATLQRSFREAA